MKWYSVLGGGFLALGLALLLIMRAKGPCAGCLSHSAHREAVVMRVVNVLDKAQFDDMHIVGSISVPYEELQAAARSWNKHDVLVLYCSNYLCSASGAGVALLRKQGFTNVRAYEGGMAEWYALQKTDARYLCEGPGRGEYLTMHIDLPPQETVEAGRAVITAPELLEEMTTAGLLVQDARA